MINILEFNDNERTEVNSYIAFAAPRSIVGNAVIITEDPIEKAEVFVSVYRIFMCAKNIVQQKSLKEKLTSLLKESEDCYKEIFPVICDKKSKSAYTQFVVRNRLASIITNPEYIESINNIIDIFAIIAEKHEIINLNKISGLDLETDEGQRLQKSLLSSVAEPAQEEEFE